MRRSHLGVVALSCLAFLFLSVGAHAASGQANAAASVAPALTIFFTADTKGYYDPCPT